MFENEYSRKTAVIYLRQRKGEGRRISRRSDALMDWALRNGYEVSGQFVDDEEKVGWTRYGLNDAINKAKRTGSMAIITESTEDLSFYKETVEAIEEITTKNRCTIIYAQKERESEEPISSYPDARACPDQMSA